MQVSEVMTPDVEVVSPDLPLGDAARTMRNLDVGCLPVGENDRLVGMLTDRDIVIRAVADSRDPDRTSVRDCMSTDIVWCFDDSDVEEVAAMMEREQIRRLPVVNRDKRLVGIVSLGDVSTRTGNRQLAGEITREVSQPGHTRH